MALFPGRKIPMSRRSSPSNKENLPSNTRTSSTINSNTKPGNRQSNAWTSQTIAGDYSGGTQAPNPNAHRPIYGAVPTANRKTLQLNLTLPSKRILSTRSFPLPPSTNNSARTTVQCRPLHLPLLVNNLLSVSLPIPPNWHENMENVEESLDPYKLFPVASTTREFRILEKLLKPLNIHGIQQIANPTVWTRFVNARKEMLKAKCTDATVLKDLGVSAREIEQKRQSINFFRHSAVDAAPFDDNFALLFHCTGDPTSVELILRDGFDERLSKGGMLGKGIYFADRSEKAIQYDRNDGSVILICGVLLGDCLAHKHTNFAGGKGAGPVKGPEKLLAERRNTDDYNYDSAMGTFKFNEYVAYNRSQCYPLYKVTYSRKGWNYAAASFDDVATPPFGWLPENEFHKLPGHSTWALHAKTVFDEMKARPISVSKESTDKRSFEQSLELEELKCRDHTNPDDSRSVEEILLEIWKMPIPTIRLQEMCSICYNSYSQVSNSWKKLVQCDHKLCQDCYKKIEITRKTMKGVSHTSMKCPFCHLTSGVAIGTCPNGEMNVSVIESHCAGYEDCGTIMITYTLKTNASLYSYVIRRRQAFLPNNAEGQNILRLLRVAWDRRLVLTVATSYMTRQQNSVVWNIHHKTSQIGGARLGGYPDETYFPRVRAELKDLGVE